MNKNEIIKKLRTFKKAASMHYPITKMYLFGSVASGKMHKWSDIDLIIVSPKFNKLNFFKRGARMYDYWNLGKPVDFICYTPMEFTRLSKGQTLVRTAIEKGIKI